MKFTDLFIKRPVLALVVNLVILIAGVQAYRTLNVRQYPQSENATVTVTTVYVGASAELVRGFITTPLERSIAAADGIDYLASTSVQGISTISARLKLNYDPIKALAEISSKVDQVRNNLPAEAQVPVDQRPVGRLAVRLGLPELHLGDPPPERDHRLPGAGGAAAPLGDPGRAAGRHPGRADLRHARLAQAGPAGGVQRQPLPGERRPGGEQPPERARQHEGQPDPGRPHANTDLRSVEEFKNLVVRQQNNAIVRMRDVADVELGAEDYDTDVKFPARRRCSWGSSCCRTPTRSTSSARCPQRDGPIKKDLPGGMQAGVAYDATAYINDAIHEVFHTLGDTLLIVVVVIFLFLGLVPLGADPDRGDPAFARSARSS
jgi:multidrug efflux pump